MRRPPRSPLFPYTTLFRSDLDPPREQPGAAGQILRALESLGLEWDGPEAFRSEEHTSELQSLAYLVFRPLLEYTGTCRNGLPAGKTPRALRMRTTAEPICFVDRVQGKIEQSVERDVGDFIVCRADGQFAYQLAVVVDDAEQGITDVVRGADLLD